MTITGEPIPKAIKKKKSERATNRINTRPTSHTTTKRYTTLITRLWWAAILTSPAEKHSKVAVDQEQRINGRIKATNTILVRNVMLGVKSDDQDCMRWHEMFDIKVSKNIVSCARRNLLRTFAWRS
jgi:hypothetical protein